jgi:L-seryl-tRNA(Ser) seleniumtransferase
MNARQIPSIEALLERPSLVSAAAAHGRERVADAARRAAAALRAQLQSGSGLPSSDASAADWIEAQTLGALREARVPSLRRVINATGVILHTNLGRAPLATAAVARVADLAAGYSTLEYDLASGRRGHRHVHAERAICELTGAAAALVVNNNAAAVLLTLAGLAAGREVVVSRGELVEIGGGFRVPDVMAQSGAVLREVGTTNRTRAADYAAAVSERTALLLRVHPSNFRIEGFTERPTLADLAGVARKLDLPLVEDLGSGWIAPDNNAPSLGDEPSVRASLAAGADLVLWSGDKLLGGPQAGIITGRSDLVGRLRTHPLLRAVRADKLTYAALGATLTLWLNPVTRTQLPVYKMLTLTADEIAQRASHIAREVSGLPGVRCHLVDGASTTGGGSAPDTSLPTRLLVVTVDGLSANDLESRLRQNDPPIIARIQDGTVVMDLRTVLEEEDLKLVECLKAIVLTT